MTPGPSEIVVVVCCSRLPVVVGDATMTPTPLFLRAYCGREGAERGGGGLSEEMGVMSRRWKKGAASCRLARL